MKKGGINPKYMVLGCCLWVAKNVLENGNTSFGREQFQSFHARQ